MERIASVLKSHSLLTALAFTWSQRRFGVLAEWTAAKTLRRMTKHLREHYPWMQEIAGQLSTR